MKLTAGATLRLAELSHVILLEPEWNGDQPGDATVEASVDGKTWRPVFHLHSDSLGPQKVDAVGQYFRLQTGLNNAQGVMRVTAEPASKADSVNIFMGTNNQGSSYSHGNQYPGVHTPFGMSAWSVGTANLQQSWFYDFKDTAITGIKLTHQPTVWGNDFGALDFMPMTTPPSADYSARASRFQRVNEIARPYFYQNTLDRYDVTFAFAPSDRGAIFQFHFPASGPAFLAINGDGADSVTQVPQSQTTAASALQGHVNNGGVDLYFRAEFDRPLQALTHASGLAGGLQFSAPAAGEENLVTMKIATSYISFEQARDNLAVELQAHTLVTLTEQAKAKWEASLGKIAVTGSSASDRMTFYSALYRVMAFPKMHWEPIGTTPGTSQYQSPFDHRLHQNAKIWTGNGFWDTYRAVWPLLSILFPEQTGEMLDGFVNSYKEGGWTVRWSDPGYWECMIGTHTDVIFADAYLKGIRNWDYSTGYEASLKNALVAGGHDGKGRRFLERSAFLGYVPWTGNSSDDEVGARTVEDSINDFGISQFAKELGKISDAAYFRNRALGYANLWSPELRFFRGKTAAGTWRTSDADFNPFAWRYEWTEGDAWHYRAAPAQDGAGLVGLFGGQEKLEAGLDEILAASPRYDTGGYGGTIHEMVEAQATGQLGFGQFAIGNEPAHHILHMYAFAGRPSKTQHWVRRALGELFTSGFADGYGYPGDEDTGEMSAWYVMNAMGLYSAAPASGEYVLTSPLFDEITLQHANGTTFHIVAANSEDHAYVDHATLNGAAYDRPFLAHSDLMKNGELNLTMTDHATSWGENPAGLPATITPLGQVPHYVPSVSRAATVIGSGENAPTETLANLVDADSRTKWLTFAAHGFFDVTLRTADASNCYTMTSADDAPARDPAAWRLLASNDGNTWTVLDRQDAVTWQNRLETKVFYFDNSAPFKRFRVEISKNAGAPELQLGEFELRHLAQ